MGTVVIGGLVLGGFVTLYVVPAVYSYFTGATVGVPLSDAGGAGSPGARPPVPLATAPSGEIAS
jgi:multidrug efflux pump